MTVTAADRLSSFTGLIALGQLMDALDDEHAIAAMALDAVPSLGAAVGVSVELDSGARVASGAVHDRAARRAFALATFRGSIGRLVVADTGEGPRADDFPFEVLAGETARAIVGARARVSLRESEARYRRLVESSHDVVFSTDAAGSLEFVSGNVAGFGWSPDQLVGRDLLDHVSPPSRLAAATWLARLLAGQGAETLETQLVKADGTWADVVAKAVAAFEDGGGFAGIVGTVADVTEERLRGRERAELEERLRAAQRLEAIGRLTAGVAHDLNNVLTVILGATALARGAADADDLGAELDEIDRASERARSLMQKLVAFAASQVLRPEPVALGPILERAAVPEGDGIRLVVDDRTDGVECMVDPEALGQVVGALVSNARDALPAGGTVRIEATADDRSVRLAVADDGPGMDAATATQAFEPFFTTKPFGANAGLGLSTVWGIAMQSGGTVELVSAPGAGTTVSVTLPRAPERAGA